MEYISFDGSKGNISLFEDTNIDDIDKKLAEIQLKTYQDNFLLNFSTYNELFGTEIESTLFWDIDDWKKFYDKVEKYNEQKTKDIEEQKKLASKQWLIFS